MVTPNGLVEGQLYFVVTYKDAALTKPIIGSFAYVGAEELHDSGKTEYLFRFLPMFRAPETEALAEGYIAYSAERLAELLDIDGLIAKLSEVSNRLSAMRGRP